MWLSDFSIVLPDRVIENGALRIDGAHIAEIRDTPVDNPTYRGNGLLLMPGFIDMHGDMIEQTSEPRPGVRMPDELALRDLDRRLKTAGVTTAYAAISFHPGYAKNHLRHFETSRDLLRALKAMRDQLKVDHLVHARFEVTFPDALSTVAELIEDGTIDLVSLMDHTPGQGQYRNLERFIIRNAEEHRITVEESRARVAARMERAHEAEGGIASTIADLSRMCRDRDLILASHDDDTAEKIRLMESLGVSISEFPVTMEAAQTARDKGLAICMGAPNAMRGTSYSGNLSAREAHENGLLDILAADYHPSAILPAVLILAQSDPNGLAGATRLATDNAAKALGLTDRGRIETGMLADLTIADQEGIGHVRAAFRAGRKIFSDGSVMPALDG